MKKSTHKAEVFRIKLELHPNADTLSLVKILDSKGRQLGFQICDKTEIWKGKDKSVYIVPDSLVPNRPEFSFLFDSSWTV
mgnify:CR=1 FL=1